jgi:chemotaxis protein histidine kinase CheA
MDAVKAAVEELGGAVTLKSQFSESSAISLSFPVRPAA